MNCKQGDIAYIFKSDVGNYGRVVTCLKLHPAGAFGYRMDFGPVWEIDIALLGVTGVYSKVIADSQLRPFRGDLSNDEIENPIIRETETWTQEVAA